MTNEESSGFCFGKVRLRTGPGKPESCENGLGFGKCFGKEVPSSAVGEGALGARHPSLFLDDFEILLIKGLSKFITYIYMNNFI